MLGIEAIPAFIYILLILGVPKSPRWLILFKNDIDSARKVLTLIYDKKEIQNKIEEIQNSINNKKSENLFSGVFNHQIKLAFLLALL